MQKCNFVSADTSEWNHCIFTLYVTCYSSVGINVTLSLQTPMDQGVVLSLFMLRGTAVYAYMLLSLCRHQWNVLLCFHCLCHSSIYININWSLLRPVSQASVFSLPLPLQWMCRCSLVFSDTSEMCFCIFTVNIAVVRQDSILVRAPDL